MKTQTEHRLRDALAADAAAIAAIYNETVDRGDASMDEVHRSAADVCTRIAELGEREALLVLEERASGGSADVIGWGALERYSQRAGYRFAAETAVYLRRDRVRRGFGSRIKKALIERARSVGVRHLVAKVMSANAASLEYNRRLGYEVVGVQRAIGWRDGRACDVTVLQLVLESPELGSEPNEER